MADLPMREGSGVLCVLDVWVGGCQICLLG